MRVLVPSIILSVVGAVGLGLGLGLVACGSSPRPANDDANVEKAIVATCTATVPPGCSGPTPHSAAVTPILEKSCIPCHPGPPGAVQWPLTAYTDIQPWAGVIQDEVCANAMPPLDGGIAIAEPDRLTILDWVQCGAPE
jgi:hypothetical protein